MYAGLGLRQASSIATRNRVGEIVQRTSGARYAEILHDLAIRNDNSILGSWQNGYDAHITDEVGPRSEVLASSRSPAGITSPVHFGTAASTEGFGISGCDELFEVPS